MTDIKHKSKSSKIEFWADSNDIVHSVVKNERYRYVIQHQNIQQSNVMTWGNDYTVSYRTWCLRLIRDDAAHKVGLGAAEVGHQLIQVFLKQRIHLVK